MKLMRWRAARSSPGILRALETLHANRAVPEKAPRASEKREPGHLRRSKKIWMLKQKIERGEWIADWIAQDRTNWHLLGRSDQALYEEYIANAIQNELDDVLRTPAGVRYPGAGFNITWS